MHLPCPDTQKLSFLPPKTDKKIKLSTQDMIHNCFSRSKIRHERSKEFVEHVLTSLPAKKLFLSLSFGLSHTQCGEKQRKPSCRETIVGCSHIFFSALEENRGQLGGETAAPCCFPPPPQTYTHLLFLHNGKLTVVWKNGELFALEKPAKC